MDTSELRFQHLLGQQKATLLLQEAAARNRLSHAYLFRGPDGVGKKRAALTLAAYLNCSSPENSDACGRCTSCRKYSSANHPDLVHVVPDGAAIKISQVRELIKQLSFPPHEARTRVIILEDIHTMKKEAENSLLKTLEEPPPRNLFILTADHTRKILPTILSRCQAIPFEPLDREVVAGVLMQESELDSPQALSLAKISEGSLGRAQMLLSADLLGYRRDIVEELLAMRPGEAETTARVIGLSNRTGAELKENVTELLALLRLWFRDLILLAAGAPESSTANKDLSPFLEGAANRWSQEELQERIRRLDQAEKQLERHCSRTLVLETLFFDII